MLDDVDNLMNGCQSNRSYMGINESKTLRRES